VARVEPVTTRLSRVTLAGPDLAGFRVEQPASSIRVLLGRPGSADLVIPDWTGNAFVRPDGSRPTIRTLTPLRVDPDAGEIDVAIVVHPGGTAARWAQQVGPGDVAAISGPARGYAVDPDARSFLLGGDETAIPAISQLLAAVPAEREVRVLIEVAQADARPPLPRHPGAAVQWVVGSDGGRPGEALVDAIRAAEIASGARVWVAGEAAAVQRVRRHLWEERGLPRTETTVRGYWKHGRGASDDGEG
jgi:NADPH-dependent ferric siderophore reductase